MMSIIWSGVALLCTLLFAFFGGLAWFSTTPLSGFISDAFNSVTAAIAKGIGIILWLPIGLLAAAVIGVVGAAIAFAVAYLVSMAIDFLPSANGRDSSTPRGACWFASNRSTVL